MKKVMLIAFLFLQLCSVHAQLIFREADINTGAPNCTPWIAGMINNKMILSGGYPGAGRELLLSDGTVAGTSLLKDITAGASGTAMFNSGKAMLNGKLIFTANTPVAGYELWVSDGTGAGTQLIKDINPGANDGFPFYGYLTTFNGKVYFAATDGVKGIELWVTDGTAGGTLLLKDINPGVNNSSPTNFTEMNGKLYFAADDGTNGKELWVTDGTSPGTLMVKDINSGANASNPTGTSLIGFKVFNNKIYFIASTGAEGDELWSSDGTAGGTNIVKDINPAAGDALVNSYYAMAIANNKLYFKATNGTDGAELWVTDGTTAGTQMVKDINAGNSGSAPRYITQWGNKIVFSATDATNGEEPWMSDGTAAGTMLLKDVFPGATTSKASYYTIYKNKCYFTAQKVNNDVQLWQTDGTEAGTKLVGPAIAPNANPVGNISASYFFYNPVDTALYFSGNYNADGEELWMLKDTSTQPNSIAPVQLQNNFTIAPNPAHHNFTIKLKDAAITNATLSLYDIMGRLVKSQIIHSKSQIISLDGIVPGVYNAVLLTDDKRSSQRLVVE